MQKRKEHKKQKQKQFNLVVLLGSKKSQKWKKRNESEKSERDAKKEKSMKKDEREKNSLIPLFPSVSWDPRKARSGKKE